MLFAIPESHDWYDGLANFTNIFCRNHWIGGWKTRQPGATSRSSSRTAVAVGNRHPVRGLHRRSPTAILRRRRRQSGATRGSHHPVHGQGGRKRQKAGEIHSDRDVEYLECEIISRMVPSCCCTSKAEDTTTPAMRRMTPASTSPRAAPRAAAVPSCTPHTAFPSAWTSPEPKEPSATAGPAPIRRQRYRNG